MSSKMENLKTNKEESIKKFFSFECFVKLMFQPRDPSSLGIIRFLFGLLMLIDICEERGGSDIDLRWGDPHDCHFPLLHHLHTPDLPRMTLFYAIMCLGAVGIMLGFKFTLSTLLFGIPYWYIFLLDKSYWNNHSYLYGIITILLMGSSANNYFSIDAILDKSKRSHVPYWNYFILKYQFFMLYFLAGLKKTNTEWLGGYTMTDLGNHWVFMPFKLLLTSDQIDYLVVHWFGFLLDLTIGFWMLIEFTRPIAMFFCACFHLMNSRIFSIGMFPYVCLATMPLFCSENWPRKLQSTFIGSNSVDIPDVDPSPHCIYTRKQIKEYKDDKALLKDIGWKHKFVVVLLLTHCGLQAFLPYSHFITKGYNNWTNGLYGYSWDMMVHSWNTILIIVKVVDNDSGQEHFLNPEAFTQNDRWSKHGDMCMQYAQCVKNNLLEDQYGKANNKISQITSENISVYIDVWCSLNGRFQQRMYNPNYDLLKATWSPFNPIEWLMPVLSGYSNLRSKMDIISKEVYSWSNFSDVLFVADFPGFNLENFISEDLSNVTLTVLEGEIVYEVEDEDVNQSFGVKLSQNSSVSVEAGVFHQIHTVSSVPSCFMYIYTNKTREQLVERGSTIDAIEYKMYSPFPLIEDIHLRIESFQRMLKHFFNAFCSLIFNKPMPRRTRLKAL